VQCVIKKSGALGEENLLGRQAKVVCVSLRLKVSLEGDEQISSGIEFQMTGEEEWKNSQRNEDSGHGNNKREK